MTGPPYDYQPEIEFVDTGQIHKDGKRIYKMLIPCQPKEEPTPKEFDELCPTAPHGQPPCQVMLDEIEQPEIEWELLTKGGATKLPLYKLRIPVAAKDTDAKNRLCHAVVGACSIQPTLLSIGYGNLSEITGILETEDCKGGRVSVLGRSRISALMQVRYADPISSDCAMYLTQYSSGAGETGKRIIRVDRQGVPPLIIYHGLKNTTSYAALNSAKDRLYAVKTTYPPEGGPPSVMTVETWDFIAAVGWRQNAAKSGTIDMTDYTYAGAVTVDSYGRVGSFFNVTVEDNSHGWIGWPCTSGTSCSFSYEQGQTGKIESSYWNIESGRFLPQDSKTTGSVCIGLNDFEVVKGDSGEFYDWYRTEVACESTAVPDTGQHSPTTQSEECHKRHSGWTEFQVSGQTVGKDYSFAASSAAALVVSDGWVSNYGKNPIDGEDGEWDNETYGQTDVHSGSIIQKYMAVTEHIRSSRQSVSYSSSGSGGGIYSLGCGNFGSICAFGGSATPENIDELWLRWPKQMQIQQAPVNGFDILDKITGQRVTGLRMDSDGNGFRWHLWGMSKPGCFLDAEFYGAYFDVAR